MSKLIKKRDQFDDSKFDPVDPYAVQPDPAHLKNKRVLLLNADYAPLSYKPLSTIRWDKAFFWLVKGWNRVEAGGQPIITVVAEYDEMVHSSSAEYRVPAIVALTRMERASSKVAFNRDNIYLRDNFTCQYTGVKYPPSELTLDHIHPASRGGKSSWENLVACQKDVNYRKADRTPREAGLRLIREPYIPSPWELRERGRSHPCRFDHPSWADYVHWNVEDPS